MHTYFYSFSIRVSEYWDHNSLFSAEEKKKVLEIKSNRSLFNPDASVILADPFLFVKGDTLYLFYEHLTRWFGKGRICMRSTKDLRTWTDEVDVLVEPFHLSFPYVFEDKGQVYMLPETGEDKSIALYEAEDSTLTKWNRVTKLFDGGEPWYDSVIYKKEEKYYLFSGHDDNVNQIQHLFVSDSLTGPYKEHPASPICEGRDRARNAGSIIEYRDNLYRPVQVCMNSYGEQTSVMKIEKLSPTEYKETLYKKDIINTKLAPYGEGGHQWNPVVFRGKIIVATDYREKNYNVVELFRMAKRKFLR